MLNIDYNYHSHTYRCGHAANISDEEFVLYAISCGYKRYGFSDHVSVHPIFYCDKKMRMHDREVDSYLNNINSLKSKYVNIDIYAGFEAEYDEVIEEYLCKLRDKCDYMILGQHYVLGKDIRICVDYPIQYAKKVCKAIESGIFDIVAHPDIFMKYRNQIEETKKEEYLVNCIEASKMICEKAFSYDIPLEINLGGFGGKGVDLNYLYPTQLFWDIVKEYRNKVVVGIDNHHKNDIYLAPLKLDVLSDKIDFDNLNIIRDFDPVVYRKNNNRLKVAYVNTKSNLTSVESRLVDNNGNIDELVVYLRKFPSHREFVNMYYDCITFFKREELIRVIKKCHDNDLVNFVDKYYSKNKVKQKIKER